jgi:hypothetical protein
LKRRSSDIRREYSEPAVGSRLSALGNELIPTADSQC